jgi:hypothetical protein
MYLAEYLAGVQDAACVHVYLAYTAGVISVCLV